MAKVPDESRGALVSEVGDALMSYVASDELKFPIKRASPAPGSEHSRSGIAAFQMKLSQPIAGWG